MLLGDNAIDTGRFPQQVAQSFPPPRQRPYPLQRQQCSGWSHSRHCMHGALSGGLLSPPVVLLGGILPRQRTAPADSGR